MNKDVVYIIAVFVIAFSSGMLFSLLFDTATITPDAIQYDRIGENIADGNGFSLDEKPPYKPTMKREPLYPYFLSIVYKLFGHNRHFVLLGQSVIHGISSVLTLVLGTMLFGRRVGFLGGLFTAVNATLSNFCAYILTETLFVFFLMF